MEVQKKFIKDLLIHQRYNNKVAIEDGKSKLTYSNWHQHCENISIQLMEESRYQKGRNMGIFLPNSIDYAIAYFSIAYMNRTIVPIEVTLSEKQLTSIVDYCEICTILTTSTYMDLLKQRLIKFDFGIEIYCIDTKEIYFNKKRNRPLTEEWDGNTTVNDTAIMLHTSGTTSNPKRVMLTHKNLICNIESNIASLEFNEKDTTLIVLPMYFGYCNCSQFLTHVYLGGRIIIAPQPFNPAIFLQLIEKYKCTNTTCIPSMLFLTISIRNKYDMSSLRYLCFGGGVMPVHKLKQIISFFEGTGIVQTYGQTEASPRVTCLLPKDCLRKIGSVGKPIPGVEIDILDKNGVPVKNGEKGEIVVRGNNVMKGYYKHQDKTEQTIINGWIHTGDIGRVDEEGYLYIVGRIKNVIISGGLNIYPEEIEEILINYEGIKEVIVFGEKHDILGEIPVAKVVTDGCYIDEGQILEYSKKMVDAYKIPKKIIFCEQLEKTYNGKIRRTV